MSTAYQQIFGTGGSTAVTTSGSSFSLTTAWQKFTVTVTLPSISGKTIAGGNDFLGLRFNMPATVCTVDIAQVQLEAGESATEFEHRPYTTELQLCQRYFEKFAPGLADGVTVYVGSYASSPGGSAGTWYFKQEMRAIPTISLGGGSATNTISRAHLGVFSGINTYGRIITPATASAEL